MVATCMMQISVTNQGISFASHYTDMISTEGLALFSPSIQL